MVLTTRPVGGVGIPAGAFRITLEELDRPRIETLAKNCAVPLGKPESADAFLAWLKDSRNTWAMHLAGRPGHLVLMVADYVIDRFQPDDEETVLDREILRRLAVTDHLAVPRPPYDPLNEPAGKRPAMEEIAFHLEFCHQGKAVERDRMVSLAHRAMMAVTDRGLLLFPDPNGGALFADLVWNSGLLVEKRTATLVYEFASVPLRQYLAACHVAPPGRPGTGGLRPSRPGAMPGVPSLDLRLATTRTRAVSLPVEDIHSAAVPGL